MRIPAQSQILSAGGGENIPHCTAKEIQLWCRAWKVLLGISGWDQEIPAALQWGNFDIWVNSRCFYQLFLYKDKGHEFWGLQFSLNILMSAKLLLEYEYSQLVLEMCGSRWLPRGVWDTERWDIKSLALCITRSLCQGSLWSPLLVFWKIPHNKSIRHGQECLKTSR